MEIKFKNLELLVEEERVLLTRFGSFRSVGEPFVQVQICGENKPTHEGVKLILSSEAARMKYVSHEQSANRLAVVQQSALVRATTVFEAYDDTNALRIHTEVENISDVPQILEEVSAFVATGIGSRGRLGISDLYFTQFTQSHHTECQPVRSSFEQLGMSALHVGKQKRIAFANIGSWSTKEALPQGIIEDAATGELAMFQIESNSTWYYEISGCSKKQIYLWLGGASLPFGDWSKQLAPNETYATPFVALCFGKSEQDVVGEMTKYRRHIAGPAPIDRHLPTIFNEYMHLSWDSPTEETTKIYAPVVAKTGVEYYVIDCGWHNEEPGKGIYPFVGQWIESKARFPHGVRATTDFVRSLGMKAGLWIEPEVIGIRCEDMLRYYDDDCFLQRNGKRLAVQGRHFLDYRNEKVRAYMTETIRRMVEDYGADYIKMDYNQDVGVGTDYRALCAGEGLELAADAFLSWVREMVARFPNTVFEGCASGGMRMDYKSLSAFSLVSTSDQTKYDMYPYIAGNILAGVAPEQAAVWSYPVGKCTAEEITDRQITVNMVNSFLGRMHLASHLEYMNEHQLALVREGVAFYNTLSEAKTRALPYFPLGFTHFGAPSVAAGLKDGNTVYLAAWSLDDSRKIEIPIKEGVAAVRVGYPSAPNVRVRVKKNVLHLTFDEPCSAAFLIVETAN